ncbi:MAG TPA: hypothetical protein VHT91_40635 [Kofleriaceae bacterium]|jgi:hypothetical protein|nr:hypothetical protein [Kofleriaceae bacterium]
MRVLLATIAAALLGGAPGLAGCGACGNSERSGAEEAQRQAEQEQKSRQAASPPAKRIAPPVPGQAHIPCSQLIDAAAFQTALGEKQPLTVKEVTRSEPESAASCSLIRGGKPPAAAEQKALLQKAGRLGVLPGDELCNITAFCSTIEEPDRFRASCKQKKDRDDDSLGSYACVHIQPVGADDVKLFRLLDDDTRCILQIRGGPSNVNNDSIAACAKAARDTIGPAQIKVTAAAAGSAG